MLPENQQLSKGEGLTPEVGNTEECIQGRLHRMLGLAECQGEKRLGYVSKKMNSEIPDPLQGLHGVEQSSK